MVEQGGFRNEDGKALRPKQPEHSQPFHRNRRRTHRDRHILFSLGKKSRSRLDLFSGALRTCAAAQFPHCSHQVRSTQERQGKVRGGCWKVKKIKPLFFRVNRLATSAVSCRALPVTSRNNSALRPHTHPTCPTISRHPSRSDGNIQR